VEEIRKVLAVALYFGYDPAALYKEALRSRPADYDVPPSVADVLGDSPREASDPAAPPPPRHLSVTERSRGTPQAEGAVWYYSLGGQRVGPVSQATLMNWLTAGALSHSTLVWREGMSEWLPIRLVGFSEDEATPLDGLPPIVKSYFAHSYTQNVGPRIEEELPAPKYAVVSAMLTHIKERLGDRLSIVNAGLTQTIAGKPEYAASLAEYDQLTIGLVFSYLTLCHYRPRREWSGASARAAKEKRWRASETLLSDRSASLGSRLRSQASRVALPAHQRRRGWEMDSSTSSSTASRRRCLSSWRRRLSPVSRRRVSRAR